MLGNIDLWSSTVYEKWQEGFAGAQMHVLRFAIGVVSLLSIKHIIQNKLCYVDGIALPVIRNINPLSLTYDK